VRAERTDVYVRALSGRGRWAALAALGALGLIVLILALSSNYWEPEQYPGRAVFTPTLVTEEAHDEIEQCGLSDTEEQRLQLTQTSPPGAGRVEGFEPGQVAPNGWLTIEQISPEVYEVSCNLR
jgi:hypothetical protein